MGLIVDTDVHAALVALVRGLQLACLVTWGAVVVMRGGALWRILIEAPPARGDVAWSWIVLLGATQIGFSLLWLGNAPAVAAQSTDHLMRWAPLYFSSALTAIGVVWAHGFSPAWHKRAAFALHITVVLLSIVVLACVR